jgi:hypothetical protein
MTGSSQANSHRFSPGLFRQPGSSHYTQHEADFFKLTGLVVFTYKDNVLDRAQSKNLGVFLMHLTTVLPPHPVYSKKYLSVTNTTF